MQTMVNNTARVGNFTSSEIGALMSSGKQIHGFGAPAINYIKEKNFERKLGRAISADTNARPLSWGKLLEKRAFDLLGLEYILCSHETIVHPLIPFWSGSPDAKKDDGTVCDVKCPVTLKSFCILSECNTIEEVRQNHDKGEEYYWQLVSNAVLTGSNKAELIVYMPYQKELQEIRDLTFQVIDPQEVYKYYWIANANDEELPYLPDNCFYKNMRVISFDVSDEDKNALTERVKLAGTLLNQFHDSRLVAIDTLCKIIKSDDRTNH